MARFGANIFGKFRVFGLENIPPTGGVLLASNHQSVLDPVLVAMVLPREMHFMARRTLFRNPIFRAIIVRYNAFAIERDTADVKGVKEAIGRLESGALLLVFPEGTRTGNGSIGSMKPVGVIAERAAVPIVPVLIDGAYEVLQKGAKIPRLGRISIVFGKPLAPVYDKKNDGNRIYDAVVGLKGELSRCRIASS